MPNSIDESDVEQPNQELSADPLSSPEHPESPSIELPEPKQRGWLKWIKRLAISAAMLLALFVGGVLLLLELAKAEPEFYRKALLVDEKLQQKFGSEMERKILDLRNSVLLGEAWSAEFTEDQINGWLAWDMKEKFPDLVPPEISDPRIAVENQSMKLAFRCSVKPFRGVAIIEADVFMTGVVNQLGIRIKSVHSGKIPVPVAAFADQISEQLNRSGIEIEWDTEEDDPVAIVQLPDELIKPQGGSYIELQQIVVGTQEISLSGVTHDPDF